MADLMCGMPEARFAEVIKEQMSNRNLTRTNVLGRLGFCGMVLVSHEVSDPEEFVETIAPPQDKRHVYPPNRIGAGAGLVDLAAKLRAVAPDGDVAVLPEADINNSRAPRTVRLIKGNYSMRITDNDLTLSHRVPGPDQHVKGGVRLIRSVTVFANTHGGVALETMAFRATTYEPQDTDPQTDTVGFRENLLPGLVRAHEYAMHLYNNVTGGA